MIASHNLFEWALNRGAGLAEESKIHGLEICNSVTQSFYTKLNCRYKQAVAQSAGGRALNYKVVLNESEQGFSVSCPGLAGCWSQGETEAESLANIQDAIREYLSAIDDLVKGREILEVTVTV